MVRYSISLGSLTSLLLFCLSIEAGAAENDPLHLVSLAFGSGSVPEQEEGGVSGVERGRPWFVQLIAEASRGSDERTFLGQHPQANDGLDRFDREEERPRGKRYVTIVFSNPSLPRAKWGYSSDVRAGSIKPRGEWHFTVKASARQEFITLTWKGNRNPLQSGWLIDLETGAFVRTEPGGSYTYPAGAEDRRFIFAIYQR